jgi:glycosyltransferase involved in cell wall biosynthesis
MKILKVSRCYFPANDYGGPIGKMLALAGGLTTLGHKVTVYTSNLLDPARRMSDRTVTQEVECSRVIYFNSVYNYHWDPITPDVFRFCRSELRQFDVIHVYGYRDFISTVVCWYARRWRIPYVVEPMGMLIPIVRSLAKKRLYDRLCGARLMAGAARIVATSEVERGDLLRSGLDPGKVVLRRNGIDLARFENPPNRGGFRKLAGLAPSDLLVLYLGRISRKKGIDLLLRALRDQALSQAHLAVVGGDDYDGYMQELMRLARTLGLQDRVTFTGALYGQDKLGALCDADVLVLPSRNENFGNVVAEAAACGTPVIVTDRCGIAPFVLARSGHGCTGRVSIGEPTPSGRDPAPAQAVTAGRSDYVVGHVGLVIPYDEGALRAALARILADQALRAAFKLNGPEAARELSWDEPVRQTEDLYRSVLTPQGDRRARVELSGLRIQPFRSTIDGRQR